MKPDGDFARTTITVPMELKKRMKRARALANWSAVACEAFEQKLEELGPVEDISTIEAAIERMKEMNGPSDDVGSDSAKDGFEAGQKWAMNEASPDQLGRLEELQAGVNDWHSHLKTPEGMRDLTQCVKPGNRKFGGGDFCGGENHRGHRRRNGKGQGRGQGGHGRRVWRSILETRPQDRSFFPGFADGALDVWKQIKDKF